MKSNLILLFIQLCCLSHFLIAQEKPLTTLKEQIKSRSLTIEEALTQKESNLHHAFQIGDKAALENLLSDDYKQTTTNGNCITKEKALKSLILFSEIEARDSDVMVRDYGAAAIVTGLQICKLKGGPAALSYTRYTDDWVQQADGWKLVCSHHTAVPVWSIRKLQDNEMAPLMPISCEEEKNIKSLNFNTPSLIRFKNNTPADIVAYWIDYSGQRDKRPETTKAIKPGATLEEVTFVTHPFVVIGMNGKCYGIYRPKAEPSIAIIRDK